MRLTTSLGLSAVSLLLIAIGIASQPHKQVKKHTTTLAKVSYDKEIRAILSDACFKCHGPDAAKRIAGLDLSDSTSSTKKNADGTYVIKPGNLKASEMIQRILSAESDDGHMPPLKSGKHLTEEQKSLLKTWVAQGAKYEEHWAFVAPVRPVVPQVNGAANPIDSFVMEKLKAVGLQMNKVADKSTLARRLSLDLTGLPLTSADWQSYKNDASPKATEKLIDKLLANPHFGERFALPWLDVARYADTHGYHIDSERYMYRWRDWVINAFNQNMPYDQFLTQQLAGDLLPNATRDMRIATGFNRNHPITYEGGAFADEYLVAYAADRVDTTSTAFLGLTMRCAQCHDHKYEPITQKDYYQVFAYFNNIKEIGLDGYTGNAAPNLLAPYPDQEATYNSLKQKSDVKAKIADQYVDVNLEKALKFEPKPFYAGAPANKIIGQFAISDKLTLQNFKGAPSSFEIPKGVKIEDGLVGKALKFEMASRIDVPDFGDFERDQAFSVGTWVNLASMGSFAALAKMDSTADFRGWDMYFDNGKMFVHLISNWDKNVLKVVTQQQIPLNTWTHVMFTYDGSSKPSGLKLYINGKLAPVDVNNDTLKDSIRTKVPFQLGGRYKANDFVGSLSGTVLFGSVIPEPKVLSLATQGLVAAFRALPEKDKTKERQREFAIYALDQSDPYFAKILKEKLDASKKLSDYTAMLPTVMVMDENPGEHKKTFLLERGEYDKPSKIEVKPSLPVYFKKKFLQPVSNRLALAKWMTSDTNPLVARVQVNRLWQHLFGVGIVKSSENFGVQGEWPSNQKLLDWLALDFEASGWNMKRMIKQIVMSRTYQQSSISSAKANTLDPENRYLSHAPRLRVPAELIRDQVLATSGLFVDTIGGASVKPYQPAGIWEEMSIDPDGNSGFSAQKYVQDHGDKLYRRSMYTFWKRTVPPPSMQTLDAPEREFCIVRRQQTNTPLQALVSMNDTGFVEAYRIFAEKLVKSGGSAPRDKVNFLYQTVLYRDAKEPEAKLLTSLFSDRLKEYKAKPGKSLKLLKIGEKMRDEKLDPDEVAAWAQVIGVVMNLDEVLCRN